MSVLGGVGSAFQFQFEMFYEIKMEDMLGTVTVLHVVVYIMTHDDVFMCTGSLLCLIIRT